MPTTDRLQRRLDRMAVTADDHAAFRAAAEALLRTEVGYDVAVWASLDPATLLFTSCDVFFGGQRVPHDTDRELAMMESEFSEDEPLTYALLARQGRPVSRMRAEVDDLRTVHRYRQVMAPAGAEDELRLVLRNGTGVWGALSMYRIGRPFADSDATTIGPLSPTLAGTFRHAFLIAATTAAGMPGPPGTLTIDARGRQTSTSEPAERWLDGLEPAQLHGVIAALAARVPTEPIARLTVAGRDGPVAFHAFHRKGSDGEIDVVVERPRAAELAEVIMAAHDLTNREADVTRLVLQGLSTRLMAKELGITPYTVQDHLKSVFAKFGVGSRGELLTAVYGRYYLPRRDAGATPSPYGFFLD